MKLGRTTVITIASAGVVMSLVLSGASSAAATTTTPESNNATAPAADLLNVGQLAKPIRLKDNQVQSFAVPGPKGHNFSFSTTAGFWSAVAIDPRDEHGFLSMNLELYDDRKRTQLLGEVGQAFTSIHFIAVDSNHRAPGSYFPRTELHDGTGGGYEIQLAKASSFVGDGAQQVKMEDAQPIAVRDTVLEAGKNYRFVLVPGDEDMRGSLHLMASDPTQPDTWVQNIYQSVAHEYGQSGEAVIMDFTPTRTDRYGLVALNYGTSGTFMLHRYQF